MSRLLLRDKCCAMLSKGYSQMHELEADQEAIRLTAAAGFDAGPLSALRRLQHVARTAGFAEYLSSHPPISERVREWKTAQLKKLLFQNSSVRMLLPDLSV
jgi:predicted Zn-dependent protease